MSGTVAYVVLAHKAPEQVGRLVDRLAPGEVHLHVDAAADEATMEGFREHVLAQPHVHPLPRREIGWAGWSQVAASLDGLRAAAAGGAHHVVTLSGQDYPLWSGERIDAFLAEQGDRSFLLSWRLPYRRWGADGGLHRVRRYTLTVADRRVGLPLPRRMPRGLTPHGGSAFYCLSRAAAAYVCDFAERRPDAVRFYRRTWLPVEMFVPTVLRSSALADTISGEGFWHVEWPDTPSKHPSVLTEEALPRLIASATGPSQLNGKARFKLFARKFEAAVDGAVLDAIDERLLRAA